MVVGSAPLAGNVLTFARCALGCLVSDILFFYLFFPISNQRSLQLLFFTFQIVEGYGQTECTAPVSLTVQGDHVPEHVGPPVACNQIKVNLHKLYIQFFSIQLSVSVNELYYSLVSRCT